MGKKEDEEKKRKSFTRESVTLKARYWPSSQVHFAASQTLQKALWSLRGTFIFHFPHALCTFVGSDTQVLRLKNGHMLRCTTHQKGQVKMSVSVQNMYTSHVTVILMKYIGIKNQSAWDFTV